VGSWVCYSLGADGRQQFGLTGGFISVGQKRVSSAPLLGVFLYCVFLLVCASPHDWYRGVGIVVGYASANKKILLCNKNRCSCKSQDYH
jgi:hypothetical protein